MNTVETRPVCEACGQIDGVHLRDCRVDGLTRERDYWRSVAAYLASCHAATGEYEGSLRGTSKNRRERFALICHNAADAMRTFGWSHYRTENPDESRARCLAVVETLRARK